MHSQRGNTGLQQRLARYLGDMAQRLRDSTFSLPFARSVGVLVFLAVALFSESLLMSHQREAEAEGRTASLAYASNLRARVDRELNAVLFLSSGLASYLVVRHRQLDSDELQAILAHLRGNGRHIRNFSIAVGYRVAHVYPIKGNEKVLGIDYTQVPSQWPAVKRAIDSVKGTLIGPVDLIQGGNALIYRIPVFIDGRYWGLLSTVINTDSFFASAFDEIRTDRYEFAIRGKDGLGSQGEVFWGNPAVFADPAAIQVESDVPNGKWVYAVRSTGVVSEHRFDAFFRALGWILAVLMGLAASTVLSQRVELARHAGFDGLTGLPNRRLLDDRLEQSVRRHARQGHDHIGVLFIDLDGFKEINDKFGHKAGDLALRTAAQRIRDEVRFSDTVARWGGDEFVAVIEDADEALMAHLSERLRQCIELPFDFGDARIGMSASIGIALLTAESATPAALLELADQRMFEEKQQRKSQKR